MKKLIRLIVNVALLGAIAAVAVWSWQKFQARDSSETAAGAVYESDKVCRIVNADTGACRCYHRDTEERLKLSHEECTRRALQGR